jgi:ParB family chromosome partitioning protein
VVARINPVRFHKARKADAKPPMELGAALTRMAASAKKFDLGSVRPGDLALVAAVASGEE